MKNPLNRRIFRELKGDIGKYIVILLFMTITISFVSGDLVASDSMLAAYHNNFEDYNIENGHFRLEKEASEDLLRTLEQEDVTIYPDFYVERNYTAPLKDTDKMAEKTLRIYRNRPEVNRACLMDGKFPQHDSEIAIDRMYAENNHLAPGDTISIDSKSYTISGLIALPDYTSLFEDNSDMMFDAMNFSVAVVCDSCFEQLSSQRLHYNYAWRYTKGSPADDVEEKQWSGQLSDTLVEELIKENGGSKIAAALGILTLDNEIEEFVPRYANQAIRFAGDDISGDRNMMIAFLCILIVIMAFIFGVTISHTLTKESSVIGTLRASGFTKRELFFQYITTPVLITVLGAIAGNILGYTVMKNTIANLYYSSYSLTTYETIWNTQAFVMTTVIPLVLMLLITSITILRKLQYTPLQFLRRDFSKSRSKKAVKLPDIGFFNRFRLRIILQNISGYVTLLFGIFVSSVLLLFGLLLSPLLSEVASLSIASMPARYQYMLKEDVEIQNTSAEKFAVTSLVTYQNGYNRESASVYGIVDDSRYITEQMPARGVLISSGYSEKYLLEEGDTFLMKEPYENRLYEFTVAGIFNAPTTISVYMSHSSFCDTFEEDDDFYNACFSDEILDDVSDEDIYSCITEADMTKLSDQLTLSMGNMFQLFTVFAIVLFLLVVYLLTKIILERNSNSISMVKILGYTDGEIGRLYLIATSWVVVLSILVSYAAVTVILDAIFVLFMKTFSGWIPFQMAFSTYLKAFVLTIAAYVFIALLQMRKIKKVPLDEALKCE